MIAATPEHVGIALLARCLLQANASMIRHRTSTCGGFVLVEIMPFRVSGANHQLSMLELLQNLIPLLEAHGGDNPKTGQAGRLP